MIKFRLLALALFILFASACVSSGGDDDNNESSNNNPSNGNSNSPIFTIESSTDNSGLARVSFSLPDGANKFSIVAESLGRQLRFTSLSDSRGTNYLNPGGEFISFADQFESNVQNANAPSRVVDPPLIPGDSITASVSVTGSSTNVVFTIASRADGNLNGGSLNVNVFLVGPVAQSGEIRDVINSAIQVMRNIYSSAAGISLNVRVIDISGPALLPTPFGGSTFYGSAAASAPFPSVNIFVGTDIGGSASGALGVSSGIPGPPTPSLRSAVVVSLSAGSGPDGNFSSVETRLLGETFAHEAGHFMGLFHPVEIANGPTTDFDPISDTPTCATFGDCLANISLTSNLMFPTPVENEQGALIPQNNLSGGQAGVMNRYGAVE